MSHLASFEHEYTPPELSQLNRELDAVLCVEAVDETGLQKIVNKRADLVESLLNNLNEQQKRCFATYELKANDAILALIEQQRSQAKADLKEVSKSSKAIKKYHQV